MIAALALALLSALPTPDSLFRESRAAMGSTFDIVLYAPDRARANALMNQAFDEVERIEALLSHYRASSEVSRINRTAPGASVVVEPEVFALLLRASEFSRDSDGAFDITVGRLVDAWGFFRGQGRIPDDSALARARAATGWRRLQLDPRTRSVRFDVPLTVDLGAIGKGYAVDRVADLLRARGVSRALIGAGTSSYYAIGTPPGEAGWRLHLRDPIDPARTLHTAVLRDQSLSTSGSTEKFFEIDGRRYGHILDPRTGSPVHERAQVTVVAPTATDSDALSTAVFVLGCRPARPLLLRAHAIAYVIDHRNKRKTCDPAFPSS